MLILFGGDIMDIENLLRKYSVANAYKNTIKKYNEMFDKEYEILRKDVQFEDEKTYYDLKNKALDLALRDLDMGYEMIGIKASRVKDYLEKNLDREKLKKSSQYFDEFVDNLINNYLAMDELRSLVEARYLGNRSELDRETLEALTKLTETVKDYRDVVKLMIEISAK